MLSIELVLPPEARIFVRKTRRLRTACAQSMAEDGAAGRDEQTSDDFPIRIGAAIGTGPRGRKTPRSDELLAADRG